MRAPAPNAPGALQVPAQHRPGREVVRAAQRCRADSPLRGLRRSLAAVSAPARAGMPAARPRQLPALHARHAAGRGIGRRRGSRTGEPGSAVPDARRAGARRHGGPRARGCDAGNPPWRQFRSSPLESNERCRGLGHTGIVPHRPASGDPDPGTDTHRRPDPVADRHAGRDAHCRPRRLLLRQSRLPRRRLRRVGLRARPRPE